MAPLDQNREEREPQEHDALLGSIKTSPIVAGSVEDLVTTETRDDGLEQRSTIGHVVDIVLEKVEAIEDDIVHEVQEVVHVMDQKLHEADDSLLPVLDMAVTRTLSILPTDLAHVAAVVHDVEEDDNLSLVEDVIPLLDAIRDDVTLPPPMPPLAVPEDESHKSKAKIPIYAFLILGLAVFGLSSGGPILDFQQDCSPLMKVLWRQNATVLLLLPFLHVDIKNNGFPHLSVGEWIDFFFTVVGYAGSNVSFVLALEYTTVGNAVIFSNSQAIILLVGKLLVGTPITALETFGALTAFAGAIMCSEDGASSGSTSTSDVDTIDASQGLVGDALAFCAGLSGVLYLICAQTSRRNFSLLMLMFLTMIGANMLIIFVQFFILHEPVILFGLDEFHSIWGFLNISRFDRLPLEVISVVICSLFGAFGYVMAMQYFDSLLIAVAGLLQPVVATFTAFFIGVGLLPGTLGWIGNILVAGGTFAVVYKPPPNSSQT